MVNVFLFFFSADKASVDTGMIRGQIRDLTLLLWELAHLDIVLTMARPPKTTAITTDLPDY